MQLALVIGHATATMKHPTLKGWRLLIVQPLDAQESPDGEPQLAIDHLGAIRDSKVMITSDGAIIRDLVKANNSPIRWSVIGLADP